jgi:copper chaperone CopZ
MAVSHHEEGTVASTDYTVRGMTCDHCGRAVTTEVSKIPGVTAVQVDVPGGRLTVEADAPLNLQDLTDAVDEAGYELVAS